ncbi:MAG: hypothetical protein RML56_07505 [Burkholderiales bacterium]|nr:hypothetical protein [Burkholderiales bacterium]
MRLDLHERVALRGGGGVRPHRLLERARRLRLGVLGGGGFPLRLLEGALRLGDRRPERGDPRFAFGDRVARRLDEFRELGRQPRATRLERLERAAQVHRGLLFELRGALFAGERGARGRESLLRRAVRLLGLRQAAGFGRARLGGARRRGAPLGVARDPGV